MYDVYNSINGYNPNRNRKILIVSDEMIADIMTNKKLQAIIKELFIRCRKLYLSLVFIIQSYFSVPTEFRLNSMHYLIMKIHSKKEPQQIAINHSADIDYKDFIKIYKKCTRKPCSFLTIDNTLPANDLLRFTKSILDPLQRRKILDYKIKENQAQYDLNREAAKVFALSPKELDKYEYQEQLNKLNLNIFQWVRFLIQDYKKMTKWKEFSKRLKNIEDTTKDQIKNQLKPIEIDVNSANKNIFRKLGF